MTNEPDERVDELLSADLDGETTPADHARIETDPELRSRRDELAAAAHLMRLPPPPLAPARVDALISRALARPELDDSERLEETPATLLAPKPAARRTNRRMAALVAAAAVLVAAAGIGLVVTARSSEHAGDTASRGADPDRESKSASVPRRAGDVAPTTTAPSREQARRASPTTSGSLGDFPSRAALRSALKEQVPPVRLQSDQASGGARLSTGQADRCAGVVEARDPLLKRANRRAAFLASIGGEPVMVFEYRAQAVGSARITTRVVAVGVAACDERVNFQR